jgi:hypothetical protein
VPTVLDCHTFSLDLPGGRLLFSKLTAIWPRNDEDTSLAEVFHSSGFDPSMLTWGKRKFDLWLDVLQLTAKVGLLRRVMESLAENLAPELHTVLSQLPEVDIALVKVGAPPDANPFDGRLLPQRRPFLDRNQIRSSLADLASKDGARVLIVDGPSGSGRSHIWFLITHGCVRLGLAPNSAVRIQPSQVAVGGHAWGPLDLMKEVAQRFEWKEPEFDPQAQPDTHVRMLALWFKTNAAKIDRPRWLVIDDVSSLYMTESGQRMAAEIANAAATSEAGELRIVLLGYNGELASDADNVVARENIVYLDADALKAYFKDLAASVGEDLNGDAVELLVSQAAGQPPYAVPLPFREIGAGIGRVANKYLQTVGVT